VTVVHNLYSDSKGETIYTKEENEQYIDTEREFHYFQGKKLNNDRFLNSWEHIGNHKKKMSSPFP
jgi:hypothetical protein